MVRFIAYLWANALNASTWKPFGSVAALAGMEVDVKHGSSSCTGEWVNVKRFLVAQARDFSRSPPPLFGEAQKTFTECLEGYISLMSFSLRKSVAGKFIVPKKFCDDSLGERIESTVRLLRKANITGTDWPLFDLNIPNFTQRGQWKRRSHSHTPYLNENPNPTKDPRARNTTAIGYALPSYSEMVGKMQQLYRTHEVYRPENECERAHTPRDSYNYDEADGAKAVCDFKLSYYRGRWNSFSCNPAKNAHIIAYSLFKPQWIHPKDFDGYLAGISINWAIARLVYPEWTMRIYHDGCLAPKNEQNEDNPYHHLSLSRGIELVDMSVCTSEELNVNPAAWRFLVADDPYVFRYIQRDLESNITMREKFAVDEWISLQKPFHLMRDTPTKTVISAGLWGGSRVFPAQPSAVVLPPPTMYTRLRRVISGLIRHGADQEFLALEIWPLMNKTGVVQHDEWLSCRRVTYSPIRGAIGFPTKRRLNTVGLLNTMLRAEEFVSEYFDQIMVDSNNGVCNIRKDAIEIAYSSFIYDA